MNWKSKKLILASSSPRRRQLLAENGFDFEVREPDPDAEGALCSGETPIEFVARLAYQKASNVAKKSGAGIFLGCDTVAEIGGQVLGKPRDYDHAYEMLSTMSGKKHRVLSGICLLVKNEPSTDYEPDDSDGSDPQNRWFVDVDTTVLQMDELSTSMIESYLETDLWIGKAGAFGLQDGIDWVHVLEGSESNVVGLPVELLKRMLEKI